MATRTAQLAARVPAQRRPVPGGERDPDRRHCARRHRDLQGDSRDGREADDRGGAAQREDVDDQLAAWRVRNHVGRGWQFLECVSVRNLGLDYYTKYASEVDAVTSEQALAMAKKYLGADRLVVIAVGDRAKKSNPC